MAIASGGSHEKSSVGSMFLSCIFLNGTSTFSTAMLSQASGWQTVERMAQLRCGVFLIPPSVSPTFVVVFAICRYEKWQLKICCTAQSSIALGLSLSDKTSYVILSYIAVSALVTTPVGSAAARRVTKLDGEVLLLRIAVPLRAVAGMGPAKVPLF